MNNCQLVNGQEEVLTRTDADKTARDFVDAYAISLAICDLERGSFSIPSSCSPFRESTLAMLSAPVKPQLHASTLEITECLRDMAPSDAAWNTWVNYRHQAMRFCQASLAENQKGKPAARSTGEATHQCHFSRLRRSTIPTTDKDSRKADHAGRGRYGGSSTVIE